MAVEFTSHLGPFLGATERAMRSGLIAAAEMFVGDMKQALERGYTSGDFVTGNNVNAVARGEPEVSAGGASIEVGSRQTDPPYPLYWEMGFMSAWSRQHERREIWVPTMNENQDRYANACAEEIRATDGAL